MVSIAAADSAATSTPTLDSIDNVEGGDAMQVDTEQPQPAGTKRKRTRSASLVETPSAALTNGVSTPKPDPVRSLENLYALLKSREQEFPILSHPLSHDVDNTTEPSLKRTRNDLTIGDKISSNAYSSLSEAMADISQVLKAQIAAVEVDVDKSSKIKMVKLQNALRFYENAISRESSHIARSSKSSSPQAFVKEEDIGQPAIFPNHEKELVALAVNSAHGMVFSSLQKPALETDTTDLGTVEGPRGMRYAKLDESALPQNVFAMKVVPTADSYKAPVKKLGEVFGPPNGTPPPQKLAVAVAEQLRTTFGGVPKTRNIRAAMDKPSKPTMPAPHWLGYRSLATRSDRSWRKRESSIPTDFVKAFTSFAPRHDTCNSPISYSVKNMIYWKRNGDKDIKAAFPELEKEMQKEAAPSAENDEDAQAFKDLADNFIDPALLESQSSEDSEGGAAGETLSKISSLLQSLRIQQYERVAGRKKGEKGDPFTPTEEETQLFNQLQEQFAQVIADLPPHLIATVDGHKDSPLVVSSKLVSTEGAKVYAGSLPALNQAQRQQLPPAAPSPSPQPIPRPVPQATMTPAPVYPQQPLPVHSIGPPGSVPLAVPPGPIQAPSPAPVHVPAPPQTPHYMPVRPAPSAPIDVPPPPPTARVPTARSYPSAGPGYHPGYAPSPYGHPMSPAPSVQHLPPAPSPYAPQQVPPQYAPSPTPHPHQIPPSQPHTPQPQPHPHPQQQQPHPYLNHQHFQQQQALREQAIRDRIRQDNINRAMQPAYQQQQQQQAVASASASPMASASQSPAPGPVQMRNVPSPAPPVGGPFVGVPQAPSGYPGQVQVQGQGQGR